MATRTGAYSAKSQRTTHRAGASKQGAQNGARKGTSRPPKEQEKPLGKLPRK
jgi:hypothetical protein